MEATQTKPAAQKPKWTLADVSSGRKQQPYRIMLAGTEGVGKSTFAAGAPKPIFLGAEDGAGHLDIERLPQPKTWADAFHAVDLLATETHDFKTMVVDTVDWLEPLVWNAICIRDKKLNADGEPDVEVYGFGKGYSAALDEWRKYLVQLERLRAKGMHVVLLAHTHLRTFKNPVGDDFDRYELKLNLKAGGLLKEWCDAVLFANYETFAVKKDANSKFEKAKGVSSGARYIYTERTAGYDAKNRFALPSQLPLSWEAFETAVKLGQPEDPAVLLVAINAGAAVLPKEEQEKITSAISRAAGNAVKLSQLLNYVVAKGAKNV